MSNKIITTRFDDKKSMSLIKIAYIESFVIIILMPLNRLLKIKITF